MKHRLKYFSFIPLCLFFMFGIFACKNISPTDAVPLDCPFTEMSWSSTPEDVFEAEGECDSSYDSVYDGTCYTYPGEYNGLGGTIKYMFDDQERLMCVAWTYSCEDTDELKSLYDTISASVNERFGESSYNANNPGNSGNVWYLESGDIVLSTMITSDSKALQYAYLHPSVSNTEEASADN